MLLYGSSNISHKHPIVAWAWTINLQAPIAQPLK